MTYQSEPTRWTESPGDAPELLRGAFRACVDEGPSDFQMRSLALKLAVVGGSAAVIAGAATASASAASATAASAGTVAGGTLAAGGSALSLVKVAAVSVALLGAAATGAVLVRRDAAPIEPARHRAPTMAAPVTREAESKPTEEQVRPRPAVERAVTAPKDERAVSLPAPTREAVPATKRAAVAPEEGSVRATRSEDEARAPSAGERRESRHHARVSSRDTTRARAPEPTSAAVSQVELPRELSRSASARGASPGELEMLHHARAALSVRPLSAFALTEQHRASYPDGVFAQERDALAVEAMLRAGDMGRARSLAEGFISKYPSSPHAHRFRETMKLQ